MNSWLSIVDSRCREGPVGVSPRFHASLHANRHSPHSFSTKTTKKLSRKKQGQKTHRQYSPGCSRCCGSAAASTRCLRHGASHSYRWKSALEGLGSRRGSGSAHGTSDDDLSTRRLGRSTSNKCPGRSASSEYPKPTIPGSLP